MNYVELRRLERAVAANPESKELRLELWKAQVTFNHG